MRTYLVTGGAGFIGINFIRYMFDKYGEDIKIVNIDKITYAGNDNIFSTLSLERTYKNYFFEKVDICDRESIDNLFKKYRPHIVINFAAESHVDRSIENPEIFVKTNILGTQVLLDSCLKYDVERYHQISTDEVYGTLGETGYFNESSPLNPRSPYSASKASADLLCNAYYQTFNLPITISRCSNNYGPYQHREKLIPLIINNLLVGKKLPVYGKGDNVRDWLYVEDHCSAVDLILQKGKIGETYNIGGHNEWKNIDLIKLLIKFVHDALPESDSRRRHIHEGLISFVQDRKGHDFRYAIDPSKIKNLGWASTKTFEKHLCETVQWYLNKLLGSDGK